MRKGEGRVFVRASNTEDVVRVFAETERGEGQCKNLAEEVERVVLKWCGARSKM
jgi:phosphomannomutase